MTTTTNTRMTAETTLDRITRRNTCSDSFRELADAQYVPTLRGAGRRRREMQILADAYDLYQADLGRARRCHRG